MVKQSARFVSIKLDAEKAGKALAKKYNVRGFPTILFLTPDGEVIGKIGGYKKPKEFAADMETHAAAYAKKAGAAPAGGRMAKPGVKNTPRGDQSPGQADAEAAVAQAKQGSLADAEASLLRAEGAKFTGDAMVQAYTAVSVLLIKDGKHATAIGYLRKADALDAVTADKAALKTLLMETYAADNQLGMAKKTAQQILELLDAPKDAITAAKAMMAR